MAVLAQLEGLPHTDNRVNAALSWGGQGPSLPAGHGGAVGLFRETRKASLLALTTYPEP